RRDGAGPGRCRPIPSARSPVAQLLAAYRLADLRARPPVGLLRGLAARRPARCPQRGQPASAQPLIQLRPEPVNSPRARLGLTLRPLKLVLPAHRTPGPLVADRLEDAHVRVHDAAGATAGDHVGEAVLPQHLDGSPPAPGRLAVPERL